MWVPRGFDKVEASLHGNRYAHCLRVVFYPHFPSILSFVRFVLRGRRAVGKRGTTAEEPRFRFNHGYGLVLASPLPPPSSPHTFCLIHSVFPFNAPSSLSTMCVSRSKALLQVRLLRRKDGSPLRLDQQLRRLRKPPKASEGNSSIRHGRISNYCSIVERSVIWYFVVVVGCLRDLNLLCCVLCLISIFCEGRGRDRYRRGCRTGIWLEFIRTVQQRADITLTIDLLLGSTFSV